ncbi:MAG: DUF948 domain-containing protein [Pseudomonadota bacterium]
MILDIAVTIMAVAFLLIALFSIPSLLQIRRTAEAIAVSLQALNENLPGILRNIEHITANINQTTFTVNRRVEDLSDSFQKLQKTMIFLADLGQIVQSGARIPFLNAATSLAALVKGVRVFLSVLYDKKEQPGLSPKK